MSKTLNRIFSLMLFEFFSLLFYFSPVSAVVISEIHFDPPGSDTDREWIEVHNDATSGIDLTEIKFFENNVNHTVDIFNKPNSTERQIQSGEYAVIVQDLEKFKIDFPNYLGKIFKASFSLSNSGEVLALKDKDGNTLYSISYTEADKQNIPSPGAQNTGGTVPVNTSTSTSTTTNSTSSQNSTSTTTNTISGSDNAPNYYYRSYWPESEKIYVKAGENRVAMLGQEIVFQPKVLDGNKKEIKYNLQYKWSFGDGYTSTLAEARHAFRFVGDYVVSLQVNYNGYVEEDRVYIKVVEPKLRVSIASKLVDIGTSSQKIAVDVVEIWNDNEMELDLGDLNISSNNKVFVLPEKLIVLRGRRVFLAPELTGFASNTSRVSLNMSNGKVVSMYEKDTATNTISTTTNPTVVSVVASTSLNKISKAIPFSKNTATTKIYTSTSTNKDVVGKIDSQPKLEFKNSHNSTDNFILKFKQFFGF